MRVVKGLIRRTLVSESWHQSAVRAGTGQIPCAGKAAGLTLTGAGPNILRLMSAQSPESRPAGRVPAGGLPSALDAWRMVAARREFTGTLPLSAMPRLRPLLHVEETSDSLGRAQYAIEFDRDALQVPYVELRIQAVLPLLCQRTLQRFEFPVHVMQRLALMQAGDGDIEALEAGLPPDYEPLLVPADGVLQPAELVEDELILAVPVVPVSPDSTEQMHNWPAPEAETAQANPFAVLADLKKH